MASMGPQAFARGDGIERDTGGLELQWGRRLSPAETIKTRIALNLAIMLQWGRRLSPAETVSKDIIRPVIREASMGPQAFARGDPVVPLILPPKLRLQWGRRLSPAETDHPVGAVNTPVGFNGAAGFRPRRLQCVMSNLAEAQ